MKTITIEGVKISLTPEQIKKIEDAKNPSPEEYLINLLNQVTGKLFQGKQVWSIEGQWVFEVDYSNKILWCYYYRVWEILEKHYNMHPEDIRLLIEGVVCKALNLEGFTPESWSDPNSTEVCKALHL